VEHPIAVSSPTIRNTVKKMSVMYLQTHTNEKFKTHVYRVYIKNFKLRKV